MKSKRYKFVAMEQEVEDKDLPNYYGNTQADRMTRSELSCLIDELWAENDELLNRLEEGEKPYKDAIRSENAKVTRLEQALDKANTTIATLKAKVKKIEKAVLKRCNAEKNEVIKEHNRYARQTNQAYLKAQEEIAKLKEQIHNIHGLKTIIQPRRITPDLADRQ